MGIIGFLVAILIIGIIIFIHEFGHYIVAKCSGCCVSQFSIGWGPKLISFKRRETEYKISCIPLIGGYVRMAGMEAENAQLTEEEQKDIKKYNLKTFEELKTWQKFYAFIGGVGLQAVACILILTLVIAVMGRPVNRVLVAGVSSGSAAEVAGLVSRDIILKADEEKINSVEQLIDFTSDKADKNVILTIEREKQIETLNIKPRYSREQKRALMGINIGPTLYFEKENMGWDDYIFGGVVFTAKMSVQILQGIWKLITGQLSLRTSAMGPVRIVAFTKEVIKTGFVQVLLFFSMINISLAIINLLPFPPLDGGHVLILSIEKLLRIKIKAKAKEIINIVGFTLLIALMLYITYNDVDWLVKSHFSQKEAPQLQEHPVKK